MLLAIFCSFCFSGRVLDLSSVATVTILQHLGPLLMLINLDLLLKSHALPVDRRSTGDAVAGCGIRRHLPTL